MPDFTGKVVLVTGSGSGIGKDLVIQFSRKGANVVVTDRNESRIKDVAQECRKVSPTGMAALQIVADISKREDCQRLVNETIKIFGQIDILINNAGFGKFGSILGPNFLEDFDSVHSTNVRGLLAVTRAAVPELIKTKGNIINVSSCGVKRCTSSGLAYLTSKAAINMITECLALELSPKGVRVNTVSPAVTVTNFFTSIGLPDEAVKATFEEQAREYPIQRICYPQDVTNSCLYLASDAASFITGSNHHVDGGYSVGSVGKAGMEQLKGNKQQ